jgi:hypothetical protein
MIDVEVPATIHLNDIIDALEIQFDESLSYLDPDAGQVVTVSEELLRERRNTATRSRIFLTGRKTNGRLPNGLFQRTASDRFPRSLMYRSGASCRSFHARWSPKKLATSFRVLSTARAHSGISITPFDGRDRISVVCIPRRRPQADRTRLVRRESNRLGVGEFGVTDCTQPPRRDVRLY